MQKLIFTIVTITTLFVMACSSNQSQTKNENLATVNSDTIDKKNRLMLYAFHGTRQCATCKNMKVNTQATLDKYFANELKSGKIVYLIIDVDDKKNEKIAEKFQAAGTDLMINKIVNGKDSIADWSQFAFDKADDVTKFIPELKSKIESVLK